MVMNLVRRLFGWSINIAYCDINCLVVYTENSSVNLIARFNRNIVFLYIEGSVLGDSMHIFDVGMVVSFDG